MARRKRIEVPTYSAAGCEGRTTYPDDPAALTRFLVAVLVKEITPALTDFAARAATGGARASATPITRALADAARDMKGAEPGGPIPIRFRPECSRLKIGSEDRIRDLCKRRREGATYAELREEFGVSRAVIWRALRANGLTGGGQ